MISEKSSLGRRLSAIKFSGIGRRSLSLRNSSK